MWREADMLCAGLDIGSLWTKAVIVRSGSVAGWSMIPSIEGSGAARSVLEEALGQAGAGPDDVRAVVATGAGKKEVPFASRQATEVLCAARGIARLHPGVQGVIDMGGESTRVVKIDEQGQVLEYALNDKCAAGTGIFLDAMARAMGVEVSDMGPLSQKSTREVEITSMCVAFAESEVVSLVHNRTPREDILRGIHKSIASRVFGMVTRVGLNGSEGPVMVIGGLAQNVGIVACLEEMMKRSLQVPENPRIVVALGAALIAGNADAPGGGGRP
jgi:predicted CoA-substrate-specific enzyme activase